VTSQSDTPAPMRDRERYSDPGHTAGHLAATVSERPSAVVWSIVERVEPPGDGVGAVTQAMPSL
jgi:hypothetical protein